MRMQSGKRKLLNGIFVMLEDALKVADGCFGADKVDGRRDGGGIDGQKT